MEYGAHAELDFYSSDRELGLADRFPLTIEGLLGLILIPADRDLLLVAVQKSDDLGPNSLTFNDGYVYVNSALGLVMLGDTGTAGEAANQLNVPYLALRYLRQSIWR